MSTAPRTPSPLDAASEEYVHRIAVLDPTAAMEWGIGDNHGDLPDFSPAFHEAIAAEARDFLRRVDELEPGFDTVDEVTAAAARDRMGLIRELHDAGEDVREVNNITTPVQTIRTLLTMHDTSTAEGREQATSQLACVPQALAGYRESLEQAAARGLPAARRQILLLAGQCDDLASSDSMLADIAGDEPPAGFAEALDAARAAHAEFATWLREELAPRSPEAEAVGRDRYALLSRQWVGDEVDLDEAYAWGQDRLREIIAEQEDVAAELYGAGTGVDEALQRLNDDPACQIHGVDALKAWMQETADGAIAALDGVHFDVPAEIRTIECCIDPSGTGGIYYVPPSADFTRPGRMYWAVPAGETTFARWQELTTVYHEGVPGHHLQLGQALVEPDLNLWRRVDSFTSGHGEGWALYAEKLMAELGFHDDPGTRMGVLDAQRLRAARVVLDIGYHLGLPMPPADIGVDAHAWTPDSAFAFLRRHVAMGEGFLTFERDRYLGWAGQALSYALGQRIWEELRAAYPGDAKDFHSNALALGGLPLRVLRETLGGAASPAVDSVDA
ncbi:DUF885 domain-containing protein [Propioniferax innocua]|uniref:Uncharacterized protein (DUF885 family) n=1 Tax=Propioniferax innocua TaxID=1753 RepID=A0A542ZSU9_9ACTN|nr:DUF885 domain-containing protein [Propioniferax innocua]TQL63432.1 uncharacterized protein (DUF885 family) [Propioniferax innocua]